MFGAAGTWSMAKEKVVKRLHVSFLRPLVGIPAQRQRIPAPPPTPVDRDGERHLPAFHGASWKHRKSGPFRGNNYRPVRRSRPLVSIEGRNGKFANRGGLQRFVSNATQDLNVWVHGGNRHDLVGSSLQKSIPMT